MGQLGSALLIKRGDSASPEVFTAFAGLRTKTMTINSEQVDITNSDSVNKWRELLQGAGVKSVSASGSGVLKDEALAKSATTDKMAGTHRNYQIVVPGLGTFEGMFQIATMQFGGEHNAEVTYEMSFESAAEITFVAES